MLGWIIIITICVLAFILGWKNPTSNSQNQQSREKDITPIFDDGEIVAWYEEEK